MLTWFSVCDKGSLVGLCMQDYNSLSLCIGYDLWNCVTQVDRKLDFYVLTLWHWTAGYEWQTQKLWSYKMAPFHIGIKARNRGTGAPLLDWNNPSPTKVQKLQKYTCHKISNFSRAMPHIHSTQERLHEFLPHSGLWPYRFRWNLPPPSPSAILLS